jgi:hypothetical protein
MKRYLPGPDLNARRRTLAWYQDVVGGDVLRIREVEKSDKTSLLYAELW